MRIRPNVYAVGDWIFYFCPRHKVGQSPKWKNFYSGPYLIVEILGMINVRIQKSAKASVMVVNVHKIKMCRGETPKSWIGESKEGLIDRIERGAFIDPFDESASVRDAEKINDIGNNIIEEKRRARPKWNAPMPTRYIQRIFAIQNKIKLMHVTGMISERWRVSAWMKSSLGVRTLGPLRATPAGGIRSRWRDICSRPLNCNCRCRGKRGCRLGRCAMPLEGCGCRLFPESME